MNMKYSCCKQCLHAYTTQELLDVYATDCCHPQRTKFPEVSIYQHTETVISTFLVYADFDSILEPVDGDIDTTQGVEV